MRGPEGSCPPHFHVHLSLDRRTIGTERTLGCCVMWNLIFSRTGTAPSLTASSFAACRRRRGFIWVPEKEGQTWHRGRSRKGKESSHTCALRGAEANEPLLLFRVLL